MESIVRPDDIDETLGHVITVQQVINFIVLSELQHGRQHEAVIEQSVSKQLIEVGELVDLKKTIQRLEGEGLLIRTPNGEDRYVEMTDAGRDCLNDMLKDLPGRLELVYKVYTLFDRIGRYSNAYNDDVRG